MLHTEVCVKGIIEREWWDWFEGLAINFSPSGQTTLTGDLPDQTALYGLLAKLRDLGLKLVSVQSCEKKPEPK